MSTTLAVATSVSAEPATILGVRIRYTPSLPMVRISGELDLSCAHLLLDAVRSAADSACPAEVVALDLAGLTFCDLAGVRAIIGAAQALEELGKELRVCSPPSCVLRVVELSGIGEDLIRD